MLDRGFRGTSPAAAGGLDQLSSFLFLHYERQLGTAVNSTPLFQALKLAVPGAFVAVACAGVPCAVLKCSPYIDWIIETPHAMTHTLQAARTLRSRLRDAPRAIECVVANSWNRQTRIGLLAVLAGPYARVAGGVIPQVGPGGILEPQAPLREPYDAGTEYDTEASVVDNNLRILSLLGREIHHCEPQVFFSPLHLNAAEELLSQAHCNDGKPIVLMATECSGGQPAYWYGDRWAHVADDVAGTLDCHAVFVGTASEAPAISAIQRAMRTESVSLAGKADIPTLAALCCLSDLGITLDTGTMHVARAVQLPLVIIAPAWQPAHEWLPLGQERFAILRRNDIACRHCRKFTCSTRECMDAISVAEVITAVERLLCDYPPSREARRERVAQRLQPPPQNSGLCQGTVPPCGTVPLAPHLRVANLGLPDGSRRI
jgi:ADP-heptose:LPS heptosyltransferase